MHSSRLLIAGVVSLAALAGCQSVLPSAGLRQAAFSLGQDDAVGVAARPAATQLGKLRVSFADLLGNLRQRRVLSTLADVDHVSVVVTPAGATAIAQTVQKTAIVSGQTSVTFSALPIGAADIVVTVYDAGNAVLGTSTRQTTIVAGQTASVDLIVQLPSTTLPPSTDGGASTPSTGGLNANVFLQEGAVVQPLAGGGTLEAYKLPFVPQSIAVNSAGKAWVTSFNSGQGTNYLVCLSSSGTIERVVQSPTYGLSDVFVGANDHVWVTATLQNNSELRELDPDGSLLHTYPAHSRTGPETPIFDGIDTFYSGSYMIGSEWTSTKAGSASASTPAIELGSRLALGKNKEIWSTGYDPAPDMVSRYDSSGARLSQESVGSGYYTAYTAVDANGVAWVTGYPSVSVWTGGRVFKFSPAGQLMGATTLSANDSAQGIFFEPGGARMWVLGNGGTATWLDANGVEKGHVTLPDLDNPWFGAAGPNGVWALSGSKSTVYHVNLSGS